MKIDRALFLYAADTAKPALATKPLIEELTHFWSDGEFLTAYNDASLGIQVPFKSDLQGGLLGAVLLGFLNNSSAQTVEIDLLDDGEALIQANRTKLKLSLLPPDRAIWELPSLDKAKGCRLPSALLEAMKLVLISVGNSTAIPDQIGVTFILQGALQLYTTDSKTVCWVSVKDVKDWPLKPGARVTIPTQFIEQLLKLADDKTVLYLTADSVVAINGNNVKLFARLVDVPKPNDFKAIVANALADVKLFEIPSRLKLALARASVMLADQADEGMSIRVAGDQMRIYVKATFGDLNDVIPLKQYPDPISYRIDPTLLERALEHCDQMGMSEATTIMVGKNFLYLAQNYQEKA